MLNYLSATKNRVETEWLVISKYKVKVRVEKLFKTLIFKILYIRVSQRYQGHESF